MESEGIGLMDLAAVGRDFPQFGKSLWNVGRTRSAVFSQAGATSDSCGCGGSGGCQNSETMAAPAAQGHQVRDPGALGDPNTEVTNDCREGGCAKCNPGLNCKPGIAIKVKSKGVSVFAPALGWSLVSVQEAKDHAEEVCEKMLNKEIEANARDNKQAMNHKCGNCYAPPTFDQGPTVMKCTKKIAVAPGRSSCVVTLTPTTTVLGVFVYGAIATARPGIRRVWVTCRCPAGGHGDGADPS